MGVGTLISPFNADHVDPETRTTRVPKRGLRGSKNADYAELILSADLAEFLYYVETRPWFLTCGAGALRPGRKVAQVVGSKHTSSTVS